MAITVEQVLSHSHISIAVDLRPTDLKPPTSRFAT